MNDSVDFHTAAWLDSRLREAQREAEESQSKVDAIRWQLKWAQHHHDQDIAKVNAIRLIISREKQATKEE